METLDSPIYEVKQSSEWYRKETKRRKDINKFFKTVNEEYFEDNGFSFYQSEYFGIKGDSKDYEKYKSELLKNPNNDGVHIFKKRSKYFPLFKEMIEQIEDGNPFKSHDVLGTNNMTGSQWVGNRWFYGVKREEDIKGDEVEPIDYKEYLKIILESIE